MEEAQERDAEAPGCPEAGPGPGPEAGEAPRSRRRRRRCVLRRACCCVPLRHAAFAIGAWQAALCVWHVVLETLYLAGVVLYGREVHDDDLTGTVTGASAWGPLNIAYASIGGLWLLVELLTLLFSMLLLHGARKERPAAVRSWLLFKYVNMVCGVLLWVPQAALALWGPPWQTALVFLRGLVPLGMSVYMVVVVRSYWVELLEARAEARAEAESEPGPGPGSTALLLNGEMGPHPRPPPYDQAWSEPDAPAGPGPRRPRKGPQSDTEPESERDEQESEPEAQRVLVHSALQRRQELGSDSDSDSETETESAGGTAGAGTQWQYDQHQHEPHQHQQHQLAGSHSLARPLVRAPTAL